MKVNIEVKHYDDKPKMDMETKKVKTYLEKYIINPSVGEYIKSFQDEIVKITKKWKSIYSIKFYLDEIKED